MYMKLITEDFNNTSKVDLDRDFRSLADIFLSSLLWHCCDYNLILDYSLINTYFCFCLL